MTNFNCENAAAIITGAAAVLGFVVREQVASSWTAALRRTDLNMRALRMRLLSSLAAAMLLTATIPAVAEQQARADDVQILRNGSGVNWMEPVSDAQYRR